MQIDKLLTEWLAFAEDVQPSCAAGADQLDFLRASTEAELQKLNVQPQLQQTHVSGALPLAEIIGYLERLKHYLSSGSTYCFDNEHDLNDSEELEKFINSLRQ